MNEDGSLFTSVTIRNDGPKRITTVTFGVLVYDKGKPSARPAFISGKALPVTLAPGDKVKVQATVVSKERAQLLFKQFRDGAEARIGMIKVEFEGGIAPWTFDAEKKGSWGDGFSGVQSPRSAAGH
jgi:translation initiation factor IF-1